MLNILCQLNDIEGHASSFLWNRNKGAFYAFGPFW